MRTRRPAVSRGGSAPGCAARSWPPAARKMPSTTASVSPGTRAVISCRVQSPASGIGVMLLSGSANTDRSVIGPVMERPSLTLRNRPARPGVSAWTRNSPRNTTVEPRKSSASTTWNPSGRATTGTRGSIRGPVSVGLPGPGSACAMRTVITNGPGRDKCCSHFLVSVAHQAVTWHRTCGLGRPLKFGGVAQSVDEEGDHALAVRDSLVRSGGAQQGDGVQQISGADVGADFTGRCRGVEQ